MGLCGYRLHKAHGMCSRDRRSPPARGTVRARVRSPHVTPSLFFSSLVFIIFFLGGDACMSQDHLSLTLLFTLPPYVSLTGRKRKRKRWRMTKDPCSHRPRGWYCLVHLRHIAHSDCTVFSEDHYSGYSLVTFLFFSLTCYHDFLLIYYYYYYFITLLLSLPRGR